MLVSALSHPASLCENFPAHCHTSIYLALVNFHGRSRRTALQGLLDVRKSANSCSSEAGPYLEREFSYLLHLPTKLAWQKC